MQEGQLRVLLECVDLKSVAIVGVLMSNVWCLQFTRKMVSNCCWTRTAPQCFKMGYPETSA